MTPEEQAEFDTLKQNLRLTERQLADAKGRIQAVESNARAKEREAATRLAQAEALQTEVMDSFDRGVEQMNSAFSVGLALYGLNKLAYTYICVQVASLHVTQRERTMLQPAEALLEALNGPPTAREAAQKSLRARISAVKESSELATLALNEAIIRLGYKRSEDVIAQLLGETLNPQGSELSFLPELEFNDYGVLFSKVIPQALKDGGDDLTKQLSDINANFIFEIFAEEGTGTPRRWNLMCSKDTVLITELGPDAQPVKPPGGSLVKITLDGKSVSKIFQSWTAALPLFQQGKLSFDGDTAVLPRLSVLFDCTRRKTI